MLSLPQVIKGSKPLQSTALQAASYNGHAAAVKALLQAGAAPDQRGDSLRTYFGCNSGDGGGGAANETANTETDTPSEVNEALVTVTSVNASTPLHIACERHMTGCVKALLKAGADPMLRTSEGYTALHCVATTGGGAKSEALAKLLMATGKVNPHATARNMGTPLVTAIFKHNTDFARFLINSGICRVIEGFDGSSSSSPAQDVAARTAPKSLTTPTLLTMWQKDNGEAVAAATTATPSSRHIIATSPANF